MNSFLVGVVVGTALAKKDDSGGLFTLVAIFMINGFLGLLRMLLRNPILFIIVCIAIFILTYFSMELSEFIFYGNSGYVELDGFGASSSITGTFNRIFFDPTIILSIFGWIFWFNLLLSIGNCYNWIVDKKK
jgi:hypothetical protein